jgi:hypothetical protein
MFFSGARNLANAAVCHKTRRVIVTIRNNGQKSCNLRLSVDVEEVEHSSSPVEGEAE